MAGYEPSYMFQEKRIEYDCLVQKKETTPTSYIWKHTQENKVKKRLIILSAYYMGQKMTSSIRLHLSSAKSKQKP